MKTIRKILSLALSLLVVVGCSLGCGATKREDTLYVAAISKGYGTEWIEELLKAYCSEKGLKYELKPAYDDGQIKSWVEAPEYSFHDLIFTGATEPCDSKYLEDLSDIYDYAYTEGSRAGQTVSQAMNDQALEVFGEARGKYAYKLMPYVSSFGGLILNKTQIDKTLGAGWENTYKLRTTNELLTFCAALKGEGLSPFIHCADTNYYHMLYDAWFAQYNGAQGVKDYYNGKYTDVYGATKIGPETCFNDGVLESAKVMESIFSNGYSHTDSNGLVPERMQTLFMLGYSAMIANGDWNNREMSKQFKDVNTIMVKTPVISALGTKLGIDENELIAVIDYVDALYRGETPATTPNVTSTAGLEVEEIIDSIYEARAWQFSAMQYQTAGVMNYNKKDMAKDFLKFMLSDEGQEIFVKTTGGVTQCYGYDLKQYSGYDQLTDFAKTRYDIVKDIKFHFTFDITTTFGSLGFQPFYARTLAPLEVLLSRDTNRYTAKGIYDMDWDKYSEKWSTYLNQI